MEQEGWTCQNCGRHNSSFARFCANCGTLQPGLWECVNGHLNPPFYNYCTICGMPHSKEAHPSPTRDWAELTKLYIGRAVDVKLPGLKPRPLRRKLSIHGYECYSLLGRGGLAVTLLGIDENGVNHVLKVPSAFYDWKVDGIGGRRTTYTSFGREVEALKTVSGMNHPCIVKFENSFEAKGDDPPTLVFEYCDGGSLGDLMQETGRLKPSPAVEIIVQIADALAAIHEKGYSHGDVKPENILFTRDRIPRLADFNSARAMAMSSRSRVPFTPGYAAPEHVKSGWPSIEGDVWSLGVVLYEAVTEGQLFPYDESKYWEILAELEDGKRTLSISTGDKELDGIVQGCLKPKPEDRLSMRRLEYMLIEYLRGK